MKGCMELLDKVVAKKVNKKQPVLSDVLSDPYIKEFGKNHPQLTTASYARSHVELLRVVEERSNCAACPGLAKCPNLLQGHFTEPSEEYGYLDFYNRPCDKLLSKKEQTHRASLIQSHHVAKDIRESTFESLDHDRDRVEAIEAAIDFCAQFMDEVPTKGLYFYGPLGVGKSIIAGAIAHDLVRYGVDSYMLYVPEFMREIKRSIQEGTVEQKINEIKKATVVIFDDIGAEIVSPWTRDEVLGAILQYRVNEKLPTVYTSNLDLAELEEHLADAQKVGIELMKSKRIMERITHFVRPVFVGGCNRRKK